MKKSYGPPKRQLVVKLPISLCEELKNVAENHSTTRTYILSEALRHCFADKSESYLEGKL